MSLLSEQVNGEVKDWHFYKMKDNTKGFNFYIGENKEIFIGRLYKSTRKGWTAVPTVICEVGLVAGFKTRYSAAEYCLECFRIRKGTE
jgi:hypothetical protein